MIAEITVVGTSPLLLHKYVVGKSSKPTSRNTLTDYSDEWKSGTYLDDDKKFVVIPWQNILASIFDGCKGERDGKIYFTRFVYVSLAVIGQDKPQLLYNGKPITLKDIEENDWIDLSGAVVQGRRIDRARTLIPSGWSFTFTLSANKPFNTIERLSKTINDAGQSGIGDWRPSSPKKPGPYGRYQLQSITEVKE